MRSYLRRLSNWLIKPQSDEGNVDANMAGTNGGPFEPVFRNSWLDVVAVLLIAAACPIVYVVQKYRRWRNG